MYHLSIKTTSLFCAILISICVVERCVAQDDFRKNISKSFDLEKFSKLDLTNSYGNIDIQDWEQNEVKIDIDIIIHDINDEKAKKASDNIQISFNTEDGIIKVKTEYSEKFFDIIGNNNYGDDKKFEVNYTIKMPSSLVINIDNKYGDVFINKLISASIIDVKYGNFKANQIFATAKESMAELNLSYSKGNIETCKWLKLNIKYSRINIEESKALIVISKYSKLFIEKGSSMVCDSKYDSYEVGIVSNFVTNAQYSNFKFDAITKKLSLDTKYSDVRVLSIPATFESIQINNSYGTINLGISPEASYKLNGFAKYAKIDYPDNSRVSSIQENNEQRINGTVGNDKNSVITIEIETKYGGVKLTR